MRGNSNTLENLYAYYSFCSFVFQDESDWNELVIKMYRKQGHDVDAIIKQVRENKQKSQLSASQMRDVMESVIAEEKKAEERKKKVITSLANLRWPTRPQPCNRFSLFSRLAPVVSRILR